MKRLLSACVLFLSVSPGPWLQTATSQVPAASSLDGLWEAKLRFGPDVQGTLILKQDGDTWVAEIAGYTAPVKVAGDDMAFELPAGNGSFAGKLMAKKASITGRWVQSGTLDGGSYLSPVTLTKTANGDWRGQITPLPGTMTFFLVIKKRDDGTTGAFIRNPERNLGWTQFRVDNLTREGDALKLFAANKGTEKGRLIANGTFDAERDMMSFYFPNRGGTFDFRRVGADEATNFYPRGRPGVHYVYSPPTAFDDGWDVASVEDVGLSRKGIETLIQNLIDTPQDSINAPQLHGLLIARHGKLVVEEYFHGESREKPHDTRSAAKSIASDLAGAAIQSGVSLSASTAVYKLMNGGEFPAGLEPRKRSMTLENLMTMSAGYDCDEADEKTPGFEDNFWDQDKEPDYYKMTMALPLVRDPGAACVYCSAEANLTAGVVSRAAGRPVSVLFQELLATPLNIKRYYTTVMPTGDTYLGGGAKLLLRDFMKLGQVHLNNGTWHGHRIYSAEWSRTATSPLHDFPSYKQDYGYLWWNMEYDYQGRKIRAYYAGGNGGQVVMVIPDLDMVVASFAGSYNDAVQREIQRTYVPKFILPAVEK